MSDEAAQAAPAPAPAPVLGLDSFDTTAGAEEGAVMEVRSVETGEVLRWPDEKGEPNGRPWTVTYYGNDAERVQRVSRSQADRYGSFLRRNPDGALSAILDKDRIELLVSATISWDIPLGDGTPAANKPEEYRAAYKRYKWLFDQGNSFVGLRANFLKRKKET